MGKKEVFIDACRPDIKKVSNKRLRGLISTWGSQIPTQRPSIDDMYDGLRAEYSRLAPKSVAGEQISHNRRRSTFISKKDSNNMLSVRNLMRFESDFAPKGDSAPDWLM